MTPINFSNEEIAKGKDITKKYADLYAYAVVLQETVKKATESLNELAKNMDEVKSEEIEFFGELSHKYDVEPSTISTEFANYLIALTGTEEKE